MFLCIICANVCVVSSNIPLGCQTLFHLCLYLLLSVLPSVCSFTSLPFLRFQLYGIMCSPRPTNSPHLVNNGNIISLIGTWLEAQAGVTLPLLHGCRNLSAMGATCRKSHKICYEPGVIMPCFVLLTLPFSSQNSRSWLIHQVHNACDTLYGIGNKSKGRS